MSKLKKNLEYVKNEIYDIIKAIKDDETYEVILDSYEEYSKSMLDFIKSKDKQWFKFFFGLMETEINLNATKETLKNEMIGISRANKQLLSHIIETVFSEDINEIETNSEIFDDEEENNDEEEENNDVKIEDAIKNFEWRKNQLDAITNTQKQNFSCGVHNQIMGAGKTFIILKTIWEHFKSQPQNKKLYILTCFRQEILKDLFFDKNGEMDEEKEDFFRDNDIIDLDKFNIINRVHEKDKTIKLSKKKPSILIVNTDYLKCIDRSDNIDFDDVNFIILDECHSVSASKFYTLLKKIKYENKISIIGFSATPLREKAEKKLVDIFSKTMDENEKDKKLNIISNYDFINAIRDNVILPPYYILCEINKTLNNKIGKTNKDITKKVLGNTLNIAPYKKVIGWCRSKEHLKIYYKFIKDNFPNLAVYCSSCFDEAFKNEGFNTDWYKFSKEEKNCILLCIHRGREGSDIMNLDTAIYLDNVKKRSLLVALQTSGRVLRKDKKNKKTHGLIIDTFINIDGTQVEVLTAQRIINYYKQIFSLCDSNAYSEQKEAYNQMIKICSNMKYDEHKEEITVKIDDNDKHDMKFKLELRTQTYDFNKLKIQISTIIDKMYNIDKKDKFDSVIEKIKDCKWLNIKTVDFWQAYDNISDKNGLPASAKELYNEYKEYFDSRTWYEILGLDTSCWFNFNDFKKILSTSMLTEKYQNDSDKHYENSIKKIHPKMPSNPYELYKIKSIYDCLK
jgi:superfamily II DNA or RNA helicase